MENLDKLIERLRQCDEYIIVSKFYECSETIELGEIAHALEDLRDEVQELRNLVTPLDR